MFHSQSIVITGGATGLGFAIANALTPQGARLTLISRRTENLDLAAQELRRRHAGADIEVRAVDVGDPVATSQAIEDVVRHRGGIDMLFNNAGVMREGRFETLTDDDFQAVMRTNFFGAVNVTRAALPHLRATGGRLNWLTRRLSMRIWRRCVGPNGIYAKTPLRPALIGCSLFSCRSVGCELFRPPVHPSAHDPSRSYQTN